jgi:sugar phosphate isomerase/epimerase
MKDAGSSPRVPYSAPLNVFSGFFDRYVTEGYQDPTDFDHQLAAAVGIPGLAGVELVGGSNVDDRNVGEVGRKIGATRLRVTTIIVDLWARRAWQTGSLAAPDAAIRSAAKDEIRRSMDWAAKLGSTMVSVWFGQDGYDYPFQADYDRAWTWLVEGLSECADHNPAINVAIEYKIKEPRTHCFVGTVGNTLLLIQGCGKPNVGGMIDIGHALLAYENPAESAALLHHFGRKLFYLHLNDNWRLWDDDMMVGSIHIPEYLELLFWLRRIGFSGWYAFDVYPYRENPVTVIEESIRWTDGLIGLIEKIGDEKLGRAMQSGVGGEAHRLIRETMLGGIS